MLTLLALTMQPANAQIATQNYTLDCVGTQYDVRVAAAAPSVSEGFREDLTLTTDCNRPDAADLQVLGEALGDTCLAEGFPEAFCGSLAQDTVRTIEETAAQAYPYGLNAAPQQFGNGVALVEMNTFMSDQTTETWAALVQPDGSFSAMSRDLGPEASPYTQLSCIARHDANATGNLNIGDEVWAEFQQDTQLRCSYQKKAGAAIEVRRSIRAYDPS